jgi:hypothetical protein
MRRKRRRVSVGLAAKQRGKSRIRPTHWLARILIVGAIAVLAASVMIQRILRPLRRPPYPHVSRTTLPASPAARGNRRNCTAGDEPRATEARDGRTRLDVEFY